MCWVNNMRICQLRQKEVINTRDCQRLGYISDIEFDVETGCIKDFIVPGPCKIWGMLGHDHEYVIPFRCVKQIGADIVLVDIDPKEALKKGKFCP